MSPKSRAQAISRASSCKTPALQFKPKTRSQTPRASAIGHDIALVSTCESEHPGSQWKPRTQITNRNKKSAERVPISWDLSLLVGSSLKQCFNLRPALAITSSSSSSFCRGCPRVSTTTFGAVALCKCAALEIIATTSERTLRPISNYRICVVGKIISHLCTSHLHFQISIDGQLGHLSVGSTVLHGGGFRGASLPPLHICNACDDRYDQRHIVFSSSRIGARCATAKDSFHLGNCYTRLTQTPHECSQCNTNVMAYVVRGSTARRKSAESNMCITLRCRTRLQRRSRDRDVPLNFAQTWPCQDAASTISHISRAIAWDYAGRIVVHASPDRL